MWAIINKLLKAKEKTIYDSNEAQRKKRIEEYNKKFLIPKRLYNSNEEILQVVSKEFNNFDNLKKKDFNQSKFSFNKIIHYIKFGSLSDTQFIFNNIKPTFNIKNKLIITPSKIEFIYYLVDKNQKYNINKKILQYYSNIIEKAEKNEKSLIFVFFPLSVIIYLIYLHRKKIKLFFEKIINKKNKIVKNNNNNNNKIITFLISFLLVLVIFIFFKFNRKKLYNINAQDYDFNDAKQLQEKLIITVLITLNLKAIENFKEIYELICHIPYSDEEFNYKLNLYLENVKDLQNCLKDFSEDELLTLTINQLIILLKKRRLVIEILLQSFDLSY